MAAGALTALRGVAASAGDEATSLPEYEQALGGALGTGHALAFWKGRVALYAILRALGVGKGDEVVVPGYTCVMVAGPIHYVGATPVYVDIDEATYNVPPGEAAARVTGRTRAIVLQHTYGIPAPVREMTELAGRMNVPVIEDCCHTFGGKVDGRLLGTFGTAAFFSSQWNKPFSTGLGGFALVHDDALAEKVRRQQEQFGDPPLRSRFMLASQLLMHELFVYPRTAALATRAFRWLTDRGLVVGSSSREEFDVTMPRDYALRACRVQCRLGRQEVARIEGNLARRRRATAVYRRELPGLGYRVPPVEPGWDAPLVRFPVRVANKAEALVRAARFGVEIGSWFESPLHPKETDLARFGYRMGMCPRAEQACREVINLPTHRRVSDRDLERTLEFVRKVCRPAEG